MDPRKRKHSVAEDRVTASPTLQSSMHIGAGREDAKPAWAQRTGSRPRDAGHRADGQDQVKYTGRDRAQVLGFPGVTGGRGHAACDQTGSEGPVRTVE